MKRTRARRDAGYGGGAVAAEEDGEPHADNPGDQGVQDVGAESAASAGPGAYQSQQSLVLSRNRRSSKIKDNVCSTCGKAFRHANELRLHWEVVHNGVRFTCKTCGKSFTRKFHLDTHVRTTHEGQRFACEICKRVFTRKSDVQRHVRSMHDPVTFQCPYEDCSMEFHNRRILRAHVDKKHNGRKYACPDCTKSFAYKGTLTDHMKWTHKGSFTCQHCSEKFPLRGVLDAHIKAVHPTIRFQCSVCPKSFPTDDLLQNHVQASHFRKVDCSICNMTFTDETALLQHMNDTHRNANIAPLVHDEDQSEEEEDEENNDDIARDPSQESNQALDQGDHVVDDEDDGDLDTNTHHHSRRRNSGRYVTRRSAGNNGRGNLAPGSAGVGEPLVPETEVSLAKDFVQ
ncbi:Zinc finger protein 786 [Hondaea fermentalgiana]|uniref:Zinc finger protein 786 n=1 Tax=Hondaea fermentalgiana TaxID=2315210 RepID=A0A2R5GSK1_9STRA|nr:Zinc finger protein 786 [Hondaea fermentalgiana]|eukprot:GBG31351.1 Zinc finger protein 786 [Hondaea fermentalgiana]